MSRIVGVMALLGTAMGACGARSGLPIPDVGGAVERDSDGGTCVSTGVAVEPNVPNLYFVLDISKSMQDGSKWDHMRPAVANLIAQLGPNARFGATVFPDPSMLNGCGPGVEIMPLVLGDTQGTASNTFLNATASLMPNGSTPTAATFRSLLPKLSRFPGRGGGTFVILATDGGPNCDSSIDSCTIDQCTSNIDHAPMVANAVCNPGGPPDCCVAGVPPNCCDSQHGGAIGCLAGNATVQAVSDLHSAGVQTYVMGIPGSTPYAAVLDQLAVAGGTARTSEPQYYAVNSTDEAALSSAFAQIAAAAMRSCSLNLHDKVNSPDKVNVYLNGSIVPNGPDGWSLNGQTITLQGMTCSDFGMGAPDGSPAPVRVTQGCPTVR